MSRLIDAKPVIEPLKAEYDKVKHAFNSTSVFESPNDVALYGALMQECGAIVDMLENAPTVDAVPMETVCGMIRAIGSITYGKERFFEEDNGIWYDRKECDYVPFETVIGRCIEAVMECSE